MSAAPAETPKWRAVRWLLRTVLTRSARRVLQSTSGPPGGTATDPWTHPEVDRLLAELDRCVAHLRPAARLERLPNTGSRMMAELAVLTVSIYRALLNQGHSRERSMELVRAIGWDAYALGLTLASLPARLTSRDPGVRLRRTIRLLLRFPFSAAEPNGYQVETWLEADRIYTHWTRCPPQDAVRRIVADHGDRGDLEMFAGSWCRFDWPGADLIARDGRSGHYTRSRTLSRGDEVCDMCWRGRPEEAAADSEFPPSRSAEGGRSGAVGRIVERAPLASGRPSMCFVKFEEKAS